MAPTYRERLRIEGLTLAACGAIDSALLLAKREQARRWPLNTIGQLALTAGLTSRNGPRTAYRAIDRARELSPGGEGSGEPTPLWHIPLVVAGLTLAFGLAPPGGWDAGLRIGGGCVVVGLGQALVLERTVAHAERDRGRTYFRMAGSRIARGTNLGFTRAGAGAAAS